MIDDEVRLHDPWVGGQRPVDFLVARAVSRAAADRPMVTPATCANDRIR
jgi:hypothetical protein